MWIMNDTLPLADACIWSVALCADTGRTRFMPPLWDIWTYTWVTNLESLLCLCVFFFFFLLVSSSPCMFIHIKLYQQRAYTSLSNKHQGKSRYNWLAQRLPASGASCITEKRPAGWIMIEWHHGLARVLRSRCSLEIFCPLWGMWVVLLPGIQWRNRTLLLCAASTLD